MRIFCDGVGKIQLISYEASSNCDTGSDKCDLYFKEIAILKYNGVAMARRSSTGVADNQNKVYFSDYDVFYTAITVTFTSASPYGWILMDVYDDDKSSGDDLLEKWEEIVWFSSISVGREVTETRNNNKASLTFKYWISSCYSHFTGPGCKECEENYYGGSCNTFCNETANYTCDGYGYKLCEDHYYPDGQCDRYCEAIPDNNICHLAGEICLSS